MKENEDKGERERKVPGAARCARWFPLLTPWLDRIEAGGRHATHFSIKQINTRLAHRSPPAAG